MDTTGKKKEREMISNKRNTLVFLYHSLFPETFFKELQCIAFSHSI